MPQNTANMVRSFKKVRGIKNSTKFKANTVAFYPIEGVPNVSRRFKGKLYSP